MPLDLKKIAGAQRVIQSDVDGRTHIISAFGDLVQASREDEIAIKFTYNLSTKDTISTFAGTGATSVTKAVLTLTTGATGSSSARVESYRKITYTSGHECYNYFTAAFPDGCPINGRAQIGLFDDDSGYSIGYKGAAFGVFRRYDTTTEFFYPETDFNIDTLDGSNSARNPSGFKLDKTKINIFLITFGYLGVYPATFHVINEEGQIIPFHRMRTINVQNEVSITNTSLPVRMFISNGSTASAYRIQSGSWCAGLIGKRLTGDRQFSFENSKAINNDTIALFSIRNKSTYATLTNETLVKFLYLNVCGSGAGLIRFGMIKNATLTGASWSDIDTTNSVIEVDTTVGNFTGGSTEFVTSTAGESEKLYPERDGIEMLLKPGETMTFYAFTQTNQTVSWSARWKESH